LRDNDRVDVGRLIRRHRRAPRAALRGQQGVHLPRLQPRHSHWHGPLRVRTRRRGGLEASLALRVLGQSSS